MDFCLRCVGLEVCQNLIERLRSWLTRWWLSHKKEGVSIKMNTWGCYILTGFVEFKNQWDFVMDFDDAYYG